MKKQNGGGNLENPKISALAKHLGVYWLDIIETAYDTFIAEGGEYMVLTQNEAEERIIEKDGYKILRIN